MNVNDTQYRAALVLSLGGRRGIDLKLCRGTGGASTRLRDAEVGAKGPGWGPYKMVHRGRELFNKQVSIGCRCDLQGWEGLVVWEAREVQLPEEG